VAISNAYAVEELEKAGVHVVAGFHGAESVPLALCQATG
jgi:hypothetical protein